MASRLQRIIALLSDPDRSDAIIERLGDDTEARSEVERTITRIRKNEDPGLILRTGGALSGSVWARILDATDAELLPPGTQLGRYRIEQHVGSGGMGAVYAAHDPELNRRIALKVLHAADPAEQERLLREARALAQLDHPGIVGVHDVGTIDGRVFVTMDFIEGRNLRDWAQERPWREVLETCIEAGRGLSAAHAVGLVHRDFKPDNVLVGDDGRVRVVDFGLSRLADAPLVPDLRDPSATGGADSIEVTQQGALVGTPAYMAPEQLRQARSDEGSDQFAFAVTAWEMLYRERPYPGRDLEDLCRAFEAGDEPLAPTASPVPRRVRGLLQRALSIEPELRFPSLATLLDGLGDRPRQRAMRRAAWMAPTAAAAAAALWIGLGDPAAVCANAEAQLIGIWDFERAQALQETFADAGHPRAAAIFASTSGLLDRYAAGWVDMRTAACEATSVRGEQSPALMDLRMACLDRRSGELSALVASLSRGSSQDLDHAVDAVLRLEPLEICADTPLLTATAPRPSAPNQLADLELLETRMAALKAARESGDPAVVLENAERLARDADELGHAPLTAEAWYLVGDLQDLQGQFDSSENSLFRAWSASRLGGHDEYLIRTLNLLVWLDGNDRGRLADAERWQQLARAELERAESGPLLRADFQSNWGSALQVAGRIDESLAAHRQALRLREQLFGPDSYAVAKSLNNLGSVQFTAGRFQAALELYGRALAISRQVLGTHPAVAMTISNVGAAHTELGDHSKSREMAAEALQMRRGLFGDESPWAGLSLLNLGFASIGDRPTDALGYFASAEDNLTASLPSDHPYQAFALSGRGRALVALNRWTEAVPVMRSAITSWEASGAATAYDLAGDRFTLAQAVWESHGDRDEALALADRSLEALQALPAEQLVLRDEVATWIADRVGR